MAADARTGCGAAAPVEYAVAVDRYLLASRLASGSRRVYRISLAGWAWPLVGKMPPPGRARRGAPPPVVPLALLDDARTRPRLAAALADRARRADPRTICRELSVLRSAVGWWQDQQWIATDPTAWLRPPGSAAPPHRAPEPPAQGLMTQQQVTRVLHGPGSLREKALWQLVHDCGGTAEAVLQLNADHLDLGRGRTRDRAAGPAGPACELSFGEHASDLLRWLLAGRRAGPVFLTERHAPAGTPPADVCPVTGRARLSYRRAAEIFAVRTLALDPAGQGWTLHQLSAAGRAARAAAQRPGMPALVR